MNIGVQGASYISLIWGPEILQELLGRKDMPYELFIYGEVAGWIGLAFAALTLDAWGRKPTALICSLGSTACFAGLAFCPETSTWITCLYLLYQFVGGGTWPTMSTYMAEVFPTKLRGSGCAVSASFGRVSSFVAPIAAGAVLDGDLGKLA